MSAPSPAELAFYAWLDDADHDPSLYVHTAEGWVRRDDPELGPPLEARIAAAIRDALPLPAAPTQPPLQPAPGSGTPQYMAPAAFAAHLGVDRKSVDRQLATMTEGEHFIRVGRRVVIHVEAATAWLAGREPRTTAAEVTLLEAFACKARRSAA